MKQFWLIAIFVVLVVAEFDCTQYCAQLNNDDMAVEFKFTPCSLSLANVSIIHTGNQTTDTWDNSPSTMECGQSGSGTSLEIHVNTDNGIATFVWTYAENDIGAVCDSALRTGSIDSELTLIGFSVVAPNGFVATWLSASISSSTTQCNDDAVVVTYPTESLVCFSNLPGHATLLDVSDTSITKEMQWSFSTQFSIATNVVIEFDSILLDTVNPQLRCVYNINRAVFQLYDATYNEWTISWVYVTYASCDELMSAITLGVDDMPISELITVYIDENHTYTMVKEHNVVRFSDRQIDCDGPDSEPTQIDENEYDEVVVAVVADHPIVPILECMTISQPGACIAVFGYFNPNSYPVRIDAHTEYNEIISAGAIEEIALPSIFVTGRHTNAVQVVYPCTNNGKPNIAWKIHTLLPLEIASSAIDLSCSDECRLSVQYDIFHCVLGFNTTYSSLVDGALPVVRCARSIPGTVTQC